MPAGKLLLKGAFHFFNFSGKKEGINPLLILQAGFHPEYMDRELVKCKQVAGKMVRQE